MKARPGQAGPGWALAGQSRAYDGCGRATQELVEGERAHVVCATQAPVPGQIGYKGGTARALQTGVRLFAPFILASTPVSWTQKAWEEKLLKVSRWSPS